MITFQSERISFIWSKRKLYQQNKCSSVISFNPASKAYLTLQKSKQRTMNGWQSCKPYFCNKEAYGYSVDFKLRQKYNTGPLDINILFQDSVYLFSFEQTNWVLAAYSLFLLLLFHFNIFEVGENGIAWYIFSPPPPSFENTYVCFLKVASGI